jgi:molybdopterin synthase sulfur carrier subunit
MRVVRKETELNIRINFFATLRETFHADGTTISLAGVATVRSALEAMCNSLGHRKEIFDKDELKPFMIVLKNGRHIQHLKGLDTELEENDELAVFPPVAGG